MAWVRPRRWSGGRGPSGAGWLVAAYLVAISLGATLAMQVGGAAVPASAPVGGVSPPASAPPAWEAVQVPAAAARALSSVLTFTLGGYRADLRSAVASVFPGMR